MQEVGGRGRERRRRKKKKIPSCFLASSSSRKTEVIGKKVWQWKEIRALAENEALTTGKENKAHREKVMIFFPLFTSAPPLYVHFTPRCQLAKKGDRQP
ncbi:hypothetical protein CEXT_372911 [Caerostris extrusa]|uniref:Uncharacterized protein n=1 Tax=Caerostris extrusa TaxID=172846 RepID=A0AAV4UBG8_CAEEX|nr:hypothetical protein CEXT_372911 [Caerostris extrusa]